MFYIESRYTYFTCCLTLHWYWFALLFEKPFWINFTMQLSTCSIASCTQLFEDYLMPKFEAIRSRTSYNFLKITMDLFPYDLRCFLTTVERLRLIWSTPSQNQTNHLWSQGLPLHFLIHFGKLVKVFIGSLSFPSSSFLFGKLELQGSILCIPVPWSEDMLLWLLEEVVVKLGATRLVPEGVVRL